MPNYFYQDVLALAAHFQTAFGVSLTLADIASSSVWNVTPFCKSCEIKPCNFIGARLAQSAGTGRNGRVYLCPIRLSFISVPFRFPDKRLALIAGPFVQDEQAVPEFERLDAPRQNRLESLPRLNSKRARAIGEILALCAEGLNARPTARKPAQTGRADIVQKIKEYVLSNFTHKFTLDDVARHVFLSRSYLSGIFKAETGKTLSSYINEVRIEKSKALLCETPLSLLDIALLCGFEDQSYFSKVFKAIEGVAPKDFRALSFRMGFPES